MVEDIVTALSRICRGFVIAGNSSLTDEAEPSTG
jgi:TolB-like protein